MDQPQYQAEGTSVSEPGVEQPLVVPNGLEQILTTFGDIYKYIRPDGSLDPRWQEPVLYRLVRTSFRLGLCRSGRIKPNNHKGHEGTRRKNQKQIPRGLKSARNDKS
jgi:hypothetical protein